MKKVFEILKIENRNEIIPKLLLLSYFVFSIYLLLINLINGNYRVFQVIGILFSLFIILLLKKIKHIKFNKYVISIIIGLPIIFRVILLFLDYGNFNGDYEYLFNNSMLFANGGTLDSRYLSLFPYIYPFISLVGVFFKIFGCKYSVYIAFNLVIELMGAIILYFIVKEKSTKRSAITSLIFYLYNPFSILWITKCCPVIIVNTLLLLTIFIFIKLNFEKKYILMSVILGIVMGITNAFRPILIIFLIAIFIYFVILAMQKVSIKKLSLSFVLILVLFILTGKFSQFIFSKQLDVSINGGQTGFTLLVGSNREYRGVWNDDDATLFSKLVDEHGVIDGPKEAQKIAIERYKSYGLSNVLFMNEKAMALATDLNNYTYYDVFDYIQNSVPTLLKKLVRCYLSVFLFLILIMNVITSGKFLLSKDKFDNYKTVAIFGMGFFVSSLFVEVSARYFIPILIPIFVVSLDCFFEETELKAISNKGRKIKNN